MTDKQIPNERRQYEYKSVFTYTDNTTNDNDKIMENSHKQIIISGVDVSGCKWFTHNQLCECAIKPADDFHCHANPNCYYKKWQRKEEIIEKLKEKYNTMCKHCPKNISCDECSNNTTLKILNGETV